jgi:hypothetical protein
MRFEYKPWKETETPLFPVNPLEYSDRTPYNLVRRVMRQAARRQKVLPDRISFIDALRWLQEALPGEELRRLKVNPDRPGRVEPRVRKRRPKQFPLMKKPRAVLRKELLEQNDTA